jgi:hypothetical protein
MVVRGLPVLVSIPAQAVRMEDERPAETPAHPGSQETSR